MVSNMTIIKQDDLIQSVEDALQFISYYHPVDFIKALTRAYEKEQSPAARDAIAQILINSRMCAEGHRPICQDTGIVTVFLKVGMDVRWAATMSVEDMVNEGVRRAYLHEHNVLRASILADPAGSRKNTQDNTPAVCNMTVVPGDKLDVIVAAKGGGSEAKSKFVDVESLGLNRRVGAQDCAHHGRRLVPARNSRHRHRWHRRKSHAAGERITDGSHRHSGADGARPKDARGGTPDRSLQEGQCTRHRRTGTGRLDHCSRRKG